MRWIMSFMGGSRIARFILHNILFLDASINLLNVCPSKIMPVANKYLSHLLNFHYITYIVSSMVVQCTHSFRVLKCILSSVK